MSEEFDDEYFIDRLRNRASVPKGAGLGALCRCFRQRAAAFADTLRDRSMIVFRTTLASIEVFVNPARYL